MLGCLDICIDSVSGRFNNDHVTAILENKANQINNIRSHLINFM